MGLILSISPHGRLIAAATQAGESSLDDAMAGRIARAFAQGQAQGLLHMATRELQAGVPPEFTFARDFACDYLTRLCHTPDISSALELTPVHAPDAEGLEAMAAAAPPMRGLEYLSPDCLAVWWSELDNLVRQQMRESRGSVQDYLRELNPAWRTVGRVTFHLAENKRDLEYPFAFLATYATRLSAQGKAQHLPLGRALEEYAGAKNRSALLQLLQPIQRAGERSAWVKELTESGEIYHPLAWTPADAYRFLKSIPALEESGLVVRVPDWWKAARPPRPVVNVKIGESTKGKLGAGALLDFSVGVALDGEPLDEKELQDLLRSSGGLVLLRGKWVEVDRDKLAEALKHWKQVESRAEGGGLSFFEGMRLLAGIGAGTGVGAAEAEAKSAQEWVGIAAGSDLEQLLGQLRKPEAGRDAIPSNFCGELRPYQRTGVHWLRFVTRLGLGACLADDMGLGKTIQVIALLLHLKSEPDHGGKSSLLVVPASLIANWKSELSRFGPSLNVFIAHSSEKNGANDDSTPEAGYDLVITTYTMLTRLEWLRQREWQLVILDEAQAIRNSGTRQSRAVRELRAAGRIALTGTPVENRLSDLWSLFDFLNPGLLGGAKAFSRFAKQLAVGESAAHGPNPYGPLRTLVGPYILRRLKTDMRVIADLPEKTEINAFCGLSRRQAALYERSVRELAALNEADGIKRRGVVLAYLIAKSSRLLPSKNA